MTRRPAVCRAVDRIAAGGSFFFSSRRRHTRFDCDWSSDVCSSDLGLLVGLAALAPGPARADGFTFPWLPPYRVEAGANAYFRVVPLNQPHLAPWYTY